jgi:alpha-tubulin suppressor-like RCC1 family protein
MSAAGDEFTVALKLDGTVWAWGFNPDGRIRSHADDSRRSDVRGELGVQSSAEADHGFALTLD